MIDPSVPRFPARPASWNDIALICRRICLLRETNRPAAAEQLRRHDLAAAVAAVRPEVDSDAALEQKLAAICAAEAERVANAAVLAELLAPLLLAAPHAARPSWAAEAAPEEAASAFPPAAPAANASRPRGDPADIAHFIDEMIAQEQPSPPPTRRRTP